MLRSEKQLQNDTNRIIITYLVFGIAMAYLESAIVVYLRLLYYPEGFHFPLKIIPTSVALIETGREAATLVMIWFAAQMSFKPFKEKFALFIFTFGVWDIFYYAWLKIFLNWPKSLLDWDILFLIPVPWTSPWLAPALFSAALIFAAILILYFPSSFGKKILKKGEWIAEFLCAALVMLTFFWNTSSVLKGGSPVHYQWWLFLPAVSMGLIIFLRHFLSSSPLNFESRKDEAKK